MNKIKKLIAFSTGDSSQVSTWSNVPYLFTETLIAQGIEVKRVHIKEFAFLTYFYYGINLILSKVFRFKTTWNHSRSSLYFYYSRYVMNKMAREYDHDAILVINCSYGPTPKSSKPIILFCDWTYEYYLEYFKNRKPDFLEARSVKRENSVIESAQHVFVLFPVVHEYMVKKYKNKNIHYLGNVINAVTEPKVEDVENKLNSTSILFIGKEHYIEGAKKLIEVFTGLKKEIPDLRLDIIGMNQSFFPSIPDGVTCHGYLDKGKGQDRALYYDLLKNARVFVNPNPKWASFSATLEAMYFYNPIITTSYPEMLKTFGNEIDFGYYYDGAGEESLLQLLRLVFTQSDYKNLCLKSHHAVESFTWKNYVRKLIEICENK